MSPVSPDILNWTTLLGIAACLVAGLVLGRLYFHALQRSAELLISGGPAWKAALLTIGRLGLLGGALTAASLQGASPLIATALGVLIARSWAMHGNLGHTS